MGFIINGISAEWAFIDEPPCAGGVVEAELRDPL